MRSLGFVLLLGVAFGAAPLAAQDKAETIASIRSDLQSLAGQIQALRSELVAGGAGAMQAAGGATALDRLDAMEAELRRLTSANEAAANRVDRVVADGTNRIGDLEFRLCEIEDGCDTSNLPISEALGGGSAPAPTAGTGTAAQGGDSGGGDAGAGGGAGATKPELAVSEQADFDRAKAALDAGDWQGAADQFARFSQTYTGGPLTGEASFLRGEALSNLGQTSQAARAYLDAFSGQPNGPRAAAALLRLGTALGQLGQVQEACVTLTEVGSRFPGAPEAAEAAGAMQGLGCS